MAGTVLLSFAELFFQPRDLPVCVQHVEEQPGYNHYHYGHHHVDLAVAAHYIGLCFRLCMEPLNSREQADQEKKQLTHD
jgi:hypothetical protein